MRPSLNSCNRSLIRDPLRFTLKSINECADEFCLSSIAWFRNLERWLDGACGAIPNIFEQSRNFRIGQENV